VHAALREASQPAAAAAAGVGPAAAAAAAACARASITSALTSCASSSAVATPGVVLGTAAVSSEDDPTAAAAVKGTLRRHGRQRQKHVHVAGSGMYSPATMAALQHVNSLKVQCSADRSSRGGGVNAADAGSNASRASADKAVTAMTARCGNSSSSRPGSLRQRGSSSSSSRPASAMNPRASVRCTGILVGATGTASIAAAAVAGSGGDSVMSHGSSVPRGLAGSGNCVSKGVSGAVTAAERYWAQPGHASSGAAAGLSPLLSSLFTGELHDEAV
jgi:hypothetical protein